MFVRELIISKEEQGAAFSVYSEGRKVVDIWGGYADFGACRLREKESTNMFYSATKAATAIAMGVLVDR
jgi:CubicO group peptidase (beta-lactamase class C family)